MDFQRAVSDSEITVLDYESTGSLAGYANEPWQIGMVSLTGGMVNAESKFESLLRVGSDRPFNPHAPGRHAALRGVISAAPTPQELWPKIEPRLAGHPLCAHNVATEKKFVRAMAPMHSFGPWIDTLRISRKVWPDCPSHALGKLIAMLGLKLRIDAFCPGAEAHDALYDAVASAMLLEHLLEQPGWGGVTIAELASL